MSGKYNINENFIKDCAKKIKQSCDKLAKKDLSPVDNVSTLTANHNLQTSYQEMENLNEKLKKAITADADNIKKLLQAHIEHDKAMKKENTK